MSLLTLLQLDLGPSQSASADVAALDSAISANGILRQTRRTDVKLGPQTLRIHRLKLPKPVEVSDVEQADTRRLAIAEMRDMRLEALWMAGAITDDEYIALRAA